MSGTNKKEITIAIPSYNRNDILKKNIRFLLPQLTSNHNLLIIDNCSDTPLSNDIKPILNEYPDLDYKIIRNNINIGGNANILRCFELCETEYLWVLGDDDIPNEDALKVIEKNIRKYPDVAFFNFSTDDFERNKIVLTEGLDNFLNNGIDYIGQIMFISSSIYSTKKLNPLITVASAWATSCLPQFIVLISYLQSVRNGLLLTSDEKIVKTDHQNTDSNLVYSPIYVAMYISSLIHIPGLRFKQIKILRRHIINLINKWLTPRSIFLSLLIKSSESKLYKESLFLYREIWKNLFYLKKSPFFHSQVLFFYTALRFPNTSRLIIEKIFNKNLFRSNSDRH